MYIHDLPPPDDAFDPCDDAPSPVMLVIGLVACLVAGLILWSAIIGAAWVLIR